jgi:O-acetyl-ADP-ribose deacetylase (regulator of RNase III)
MIKHSLYVVNSYTQYNYGAGFNGRTVQLDYDALTLCMRKINSKFKGKEIGLPMIGAGKAGGDWDKIRNIIKIELMDCNTTIVKLKE